MDTLGFIVDTLFWFFVGYVLAKIAFMLIERKLVARLEEEIGPIVRDLDSGKLIPLTVELHNDQFLCYNSLTDDFVCQGSTLLEIAERFNQRYPGRRATIHRGDTEAITKLKQQLWDGAENISMAEK